MSDALATLSVYGEEDNSRENPPDKKRSKRSNENDKDVLEVSAEHLCLIRRHIGRLQSDHMVKIHLPRRRPDQLLDNEDLPHKVRIDDSGNGCESAKAAILALNRDEQHERQRDGKEQGERDVEHSGDVTNEMNEEEKDAEANEDEDPEVSGDVTDEINEEEKDAEANENEDMELNGVVSDQENEDGREENEDGREENEDGRAENEGESKQDEEYGRPGEVDYQESLSSQQRRVMSRRIVRSARRYISSVVKYNSIYGEAKEAEDPELSGEALEEESGARDVDYYKRLLKESDRRVKTLEAENRVEERRQVALRKQISSWKGRTEELSRENKQLTLDNEHLSSVVRAPRMNIVPHAQLPILCRKLFGKPYFKNPFDTSPSGVFCATDCNGMHLAQEIGKTDYTPTDGNAIYICFG